MNCRLCDAETRTFLDFGSLAYTGVFPLPGEVVESPHFKMVQCSQPTCRLVQTDQNYDPAILYGPTYGYKSGLNSSMREHLQATATRLAANLPRRAIVVDIGSNDNTFLRAFPKTMPRIGIDPLLHVRSQDDGIINLVGTFPNLPSSTLPGDGDVDLVTSISVFYATPDPRAFVQRISELLKQGGVWFIEQGYLPRLLSRLAYDAFCHEHIAWLGLVHLKALGEEFDLILEDYGENNINGGSFWVRLRKGGTPLCDDWPFDKELSSMWDVSQRIAPAVAAHAQELHNMLMALRAEGARVLGYGASTKGNVLLQYAGVTPELLPAIAEVNADKWGRVTPGTGIPIISEAEARERRPTHFLVLPWHFREAVIEREAAFLASGGKLIFPLPSFVRTYEAANAPV